MWVDRPNNPLSQHVPMYLSCFLDLHSEILDYLNSLSSLSHHSNPLSHTHTHVAWIPYLMQKQKRSMLLTPQNPKHLYLQCRHTNPHTHTHTYDEGGRKHSDMTCVSRPTALISPASGGKAPHTRSLAPPKTPQECVCLNSSWLEWKTTLEMTASLCVCVCVCLVSTSKVLCWGAPMPKKKKNHVKDKKKQVTWRHYSHYFCLLVTHWSPES